MSKNYKHLNREERYSIKEMRDKGVSINEISKELRYVTFLDTSLAPHTAYIFGVF
jgi:hypothetical protein